MVMMPAFIDKSTWGPGAWEDEPDEVHFEHEGLPCRMLRNPMSGAWCGYVGVPRSNRFYGLHYDSEELYEIRVHGGLTFSNDNLRGVGNVDNHHWFGFDCGHGGDVSPAMDAMSKSLNIGIASAAGQVYRTFGYAKLETMRLAHQLTERFTLTLWLQNRLTPGDELELAAP